MPCVFNTAKCGHSGPCRWPAMVEEDPDRETYYEMGSRSTNIPVNTISWFLAYRFVYSIYREIG